MGLVETKLAIIPGGGMNCSLSSIGVFDLASDVGAGRSPGHGEGSVWVKEADAMLAVHPAELLSICLACGDPPALACSLRHHVVHIDIIACTVSLQNHSQFETLLCAFEPMSPYPRVSGP